MNKQPSISDNDHSDNINPQSDQKKPLESTHGIYYPDDDILPEREAKTWCSYMEREFRASRNITAAENAALDDSGHIKKEKT